jgi:hypothetical protein
VSSPTSALGRVRAVLDRFWFPEVSAVRLGAVRIICGAYLVYFMFRENRHLIGNAGGAPETFVPVGLAAFLDAPLDKALYAGLVNWTTVLSVLFLLGIWHRVVGPLFGLLFLFVVTYSNCWSMVYHTENMLVLHALILGFTPATAALSLDAWVLDRGPKWLRDASLAYPKATAPDWRYGWPIRLMQLGATLPYVVAGLAKVMGKAGFHWATGGSLRDQITMNGLYYEMLEGAAPEITYHVYGWDTAFLFAASMTLVLELGAPLAMLHRYAGYAYTAGILGMHWSILVLMGIPFRYQMYGAAFACFFEWEVLYRFVQSRFLGGVPSASPDAAALEVETPEG